MQISASVLNLASEGTSTQQNRNRLLKLTTSKGVQPLAVNEATLRADLINTIATAANISPSRVNITDLVTGANTVELVIRIELAASGSSESSPLDSFTAFVNYVDANGPLRFAGVSITSANIKQQCAGGAVLVDCPEDYITGNGNTSSSTGTPEQGEKVDSDDGLSAGAIAGIAIGCTVVVAIVAYGVKSCLKSSSKSTVNKLQETELAQSTAS